MKLAILKYSKHLYNFRAIIIIAVIYLVTLLFLERRGFWIVDNANKFIQLQAIDRSDLSNYSIPWSGQSTDPDFRYNPIPPPFSVVRNNKLFSVYGPLFAIGSLFFFRIFSFFGLYILPFVSSIMMLFGIVEISNTLRLKRTSRNCALFITALCTPIWFYSVVFWEHTIAICLCIWGISFYLKFFKLGANRYLMFGTILSTLSVYFREELFLFCLVILVTILLYRRQRMCRTLLTFTFTMIISLVPLLLLNWITIGHPFGFRIESNLLSDNGIVKHIFDRPVVFYNLFVKSSDKLWLSFILTIPFIALFFLNPKLPKHIFERAVPLCCLFAIFTASFVLCCYLFSNSSIKCMLHSNSLFTLSPILIIALIRYKNAEASRANLFFRKWIWIIAVIYACVYTLVAPWVNSWGIHWGNRFLLVLYPLFAILCAMTLAEWRSCQNQRVTWKAIVVILAIIISLSTQAYSIYVLNKKKIFSYRLNQEIQKYSEEIIITNVEWVPQALYSVFYTKSIFYAGTENDYRQLVRDISSKDYRRFLFVTHAYKKNQNIATTEITDEGLNFFNLHFFVMDLQNFEEQSPKVVE